MHCYQTQPEGKHNGTSSCLSRTRGGSCTSKHQHVQVRARAVFLFRTREKHIRQGAALGTAAQLGSGAEEAPPAVQKQSHSRLTQEHS